MIIAIVGATRLVAADQTVYFDDAGDAPRIGLVGDSTLTGVRWYRDYGPLEQYNFVLSAESCRRTIETSCISREGYRSANVVTAIKDLDGELGDVLVIMSGYNDPRNTIDNAIEAVVDEARDQGIGHVVWLSLRTGSDVEYSDPQQQSSVDTFREYNRQLHEAAATSAGYLQFADWAGYSAGSDGWFEYDGVHLTARGVDRLTEYLAGIVGRVLAGQNVTPADPPWTVLVPGAEGDIITDVQEALMASGIELTGGADGVTATPRWSPSPPTNDSARISASPARSIWRLLAPSAWSRTRTRSRRAPLRRPQRPSPCRPTRSVRHRRSP